MSLNIKSGLLRSLSAFLIAAAVLVVAGCGEIYGHEEFEKQGKSKSEDDIVKQLGKPASVDNSNHSRVIWTYNAITYDIDHENKRDSKTNLVMAPNGSNNKLQVVDVQYVR